jgi:hypothetical protein
MTMKKYKPDLIFTQYRDDRHQDHHTTSDLTRNTWGNHFILEYEIQKYDCDLGSPNCFVPLGREVCDRRLTYICEVFQTQSNNVGPPKTPSKPSFGFVVSSASRETSTQMYSIAASLTVN